MKSEENVKDLIKKLYSVVSKMEEMYPGRHFTPDGHLVGSLGECIVANAYDLKLMPASNKGYDAITKCGLEVEIKATQKKAVAFRSEPQHVIVIKILPDGQFEEVYNGLGCRVYDTFKGKKKPSNGQFQISISKLKKLNDSVDSAERVARVE